jgi:hypothetical protein
MKMKKSYITPTIEQTSIVAEQVIALSTLGKASHTSSGLDYDDDGDALVKGQSSYDFWDEVW